MPENDSQASGSLTRISTPAESGQGTITAPQTMPTKRGRPSGYPKSGGRTKGTPNKKPAVAQLLADRASPDAMRLLVQVMRGERIAHKGKWWTPEPYQRVNAAIVILRKAVPDLQAMRHSGPQGEPIAVNIMLGVHRPEAS